MSKSTSTSVRAPIELPTIEEIAEKMTKKAASSSHPSASDEISNTYNTDDETTIGQPKIESEIEVTSVDPSAPRRLDDGENKVPGIPEGDGETPVPPTVTPPVSPEKKDLQAAKFAALARKEKAFREQQAELERRQKEFEDRSKGVDEREAKIAAAKSPIELMKAHGFTYEDVTNAQLGLYKEPEKDPFDQKLDERLSPLDQKSKELEEKLAAVDNYLQKLEEARVQQARYEFRGGLVKAAETNGCEYMLAAGDEALLLAEDFMTEYYKKHQKVLSFEEACDRIETHYSEKFSRFAETSKFRTKYASAPVAPNTQSKSPKEVNERPNTLTQSLTQGTRATTNIDDLPRHEALDLLARRLKYV